jgi:hypothetical protein
MNHFFAALVVKWIIAPHGANLLATTNGFFLDVSCLANSAICLVDFHVMPPC